MGNYVSPNKSPLSFGKGNNFVGTGNRFPDKSPLSFGKGNKVNIRAVRGFQVRFLVWAFLIKKMVNKIKKREIRKGNGYNSQKIVIGLLVMVLLITLILIFKPESEANVISTSGESRYAPLEQAEVQKVAETILSSDFVQDVPADDPIAISFYSFDSEGRVWRDSFLIGRGELLQEGEPSVYLALDAKYIGEMNGDNLCDVVKTANANGDLGFESEYGKARLLLKYSGMMKHRDCFGF